MKNILQNWRQFGAIFCLVTVLAIVKAEEISPEAQEVFDTYIEALGGREILETVESIKITGTMTLEGMGLSGRMVLIQKSPNLFYNEQNVEGIGTTIQAYDGEICWANDMMQGYRELTGKEAELLLDENDLRTNMLIDSRYASAEVITEPGVEGKIVLEAVRKVNKRKEILYFDSESKLITEIKSVVDMGEQGSIPMSIAFEDYVESDGVFMAHKMKIQNPAINIEMTLNSHEVNPEIPADQFRYKE
ncbi:hypothetical protein MLD52_05740 [Puniceicoccaceae bacterium K14]|nr:hypothetical protein [Puniceicoccaceae bacterium K14]